MSDNWMKAIHWLCTENPLLGGQLPIDMITTIRGRIKLKRFVDESIELASPPPTPSSESVQLKAHIDPVTGEPLFTPSSESSRIAATGEVPKGFEACSWDEAMGDGDSRPDRVQKLGHVEDNEYASFYPQCHSENTVTWLRPAIARLTKERDEYGALVERVLGRLTAYGVHQRDTDVRDVIGDIRAFLATRDKTKGGE